MNTCVMSSFATESR